MSVSDLTQLLDTELNAITGDMETNPQTVVLPNTVEINTNDTAPNGIWATVNSKVLEKQKYVILDLSACTAVGNTIDGYLEASANTANKMNIIQNNQYIKGIILPNSVTTIGRLAFAYCSSLTSVTIPQGVTTIDLGAFARTSLTSVTIPDSVTTIGMQVFSGCTSLASVTIPQGVTTIGNETFYNCTSLNSVAIPDSVTTIGQSAFKQCTSLNSVTIPDSVTTIGTQAFSRASLNSVTIPQGVTTIGTQAFAYTGLTSVTFADGSNISAENFGDNAFTEWGGYGNSLRTAYLAASPHSGTYTRDAEAYGNTWSKQ
jgi:hypothetical protein